MGREVIILEGDTQAAVGTCLTSFVNALKKVLCLDEEPMINVAGSYLRNRVKGHGARVKIKTDSLSSGLTGGYDTYQGGRWRLVIFPRSKHRPDIFFKKGTARIAVSPAVIEMGGVLVTPFARDFERLDAAAVESIYDEVSLKGNNVESAIHAIVCPAAYSTSS